MIQMSEKEVKKETKTTVKKTVNKAAKSTKKAATKSTEKVEEVKTISFSSRNSSFVNSKKVVAMIIYLSF